MGTIAIFLDGGYVEKVLRLDYGNPKINFSKLAAEMASPHEILRTYYYHCLPYQSRTPTDEENKRFANARRFMNALDRLPRFQVRLGKLAFRGTDSAGKPIFIQKRVDCMVGVDMAILAGKGKITHLAVFTGDSDLIPAIEAVKNEGVVVTLWHGSSHDTTPSIELAQMVDERAPLTRDILDRILL